MRAVAGCLLMLAACSLWTHAVTAQTLPGGPHAATPGDEAPLAGGVVGAVPGGAAGHCHEPSTPQGVKTTPNPCCKGFQCECSQAGASCPSLSLPSLHLAGPDVLSPVALAPQPNHITRFFRPPIA